MKQSKEAKERVARRLRRRIRGGDLVVILVLASVVVAVLNFASIGELQDYLYHPVAGIVLVVMIIEFLWLKSGDRTRVYAIEIDKLRTARRKDEDLLKRAREIIDQAVIHPETEEKGRPGDWRQKAIDVTRDIDERL